MKVHKFYINSFFFFFLNELHKKLVGISIIDQETNIMHALMTVKLGKPFKKRNGIKILLEVLKCWSRHFKSSIELFARHRFTIRVCLFCSRFTVCATYPLQFQPFICTWTIKPIHYQIYNITPNRTQKFPEQIIYTYLVCNTKSRLIRYRIGGLGRR